MRLAVEQRNKKTANARARRNGNGGQCAPENYNSLVYLRVTCRPKTNC